MDYIFLFRERIEVVIKNRAFERNRTEKFEPREFYGRFDVRLALLSVIIAMLKRSRRAVKAAAEVTTSHYFSQQARAIDLSVATKVEIRKKKQFPPCPGDQKKILNDRYIFRKSGKAGKHHVTFAEIDTLSIISRVSTCRLWVISVNCSAHISR